MTIPASKNVVFDVVGTLVAYDRLFEALDERLGDKLKAAGIKSKLLGMCWIEAAEREYTYLSLSGRYTPFFKMFGALFYRMLLYAGVDKPKEFCTGEDVEWLVAEWEKLRLRPGAKECVQKLRDAGFTVWCFTAGDVARVGGYFKLAGLDMPAENLLSCDAVGLAKPVPDAYRPLLEKLTEDGKKPWFAAAHMWDVSTARTVGFHGAYSTILEAEPLQEVFGDMDVVAPTLAEMADKIIATTNRVGLRVMDMPTLQPSPWNLDVVEEEQEQIDRDFVLTRAVNALMTDYIHERMKAVLHDGHGRGGV